MQLKKYIQPNRGTDINKLINKQTDGYRNRIANRQTDGKHLE